MKTKIYDEIQTNLQQTQDNLTQWAETMPEEKRHIQLDSQSETCIEEHLHVIDASVEKIKEGHFGIREVWQEAANNELLQMDYTSVICLGHFSDEELRQLESELELSQVIQRGLL